MSLLPTPKPTAPSIAILPLSHTTVTVTAIPNPSLYLAQVDGKTLTFRYDGITLGDGEAFSLVFNGIADATQTANFEEISATPSLTTTSTTMPMSNTSLSSRGISDSRTTGYFNASSGVTSPSTVSSESSGTGAEASSPTPTDSGACGALQLRGTVYSLVVGMAVLFGADWML